MSSEKIEYRLSALDSFTCIGNQCPASCCCGKWDIPVDAELYRVWGAFPDPIERDRILHAVTEREQDGQKFTVMAMNAHGCCQLLSEDGMCTLQQKHGEALMPTVCRTYPRMADVTPIHSLSTLSLSCPEVARLVLFSADQPVFRKTVPGHPLAQAGEDRIRHALMELFDRIMAEPKYPLAARTFYFADLIVRLSRLSLQNQLNVNTLNRAVSTSKNDLFQIGVALKERRLRPEPAVAGSFWHTLVRIGSTWNLLPELDPQSPLRATLSELPVVRTQQYAAAHSEIQRLRTAKPVATRLYDPTFTRYLHTTLMYHGFPWNPAVGNYIASYIRAMVPFALARLRLWLRAETQTSLLDDDVRDIVYQVERQISHSKKVLTILDRNPELLELDRYHTTFLDL